MRDFFYLDIETCGRYSNFNELKDNDPIGAELFEQKFNKLWLDKYSDIESCYIEQSGIWSTWGKICCISVGYKSNENKRIINSIYGDDEKILLEKFNKLMLKVETKNFTLCGYRIFYFDVPWILHRMHHWDIKPANIIYMYNKKPWESRIIDIFDDWKQKLSNFNSLDEVCYELNIPSPKSDLKNNMIHSTYWNGDIERIVKYCEGDVNCLFDICDKMYTQ
jgi:3'-5' exonuclease